MVATRIIHSIVDACVTHWLLILVGMNYILLRDRPKERITSFTGGDPEEPVFDAGKYLPQIAPLPLALIHASGDQSISPEITDQQFAAVIEPKNFTKVPDDNHAFSGNEKGPCNRLTNRPIGP